MQIIGHKWPKKKGKTRTKLGKIIEGQFPLSSIRLDFEGSFRFCRDVQGLIATQGHTVHILDARTFQWPRGINSWKELTCCVVQPSTQGVRLLRSSKFHAILIDEVDLCFMKDSFMFMALFPPP